MFQLQAGEIALTHPEHWSEITLKQAIASYEVSQRIPKKLAAQLKGAKVTPSEQEQEDFHRFYEDWFFYWANVPKEQRKQLDTDSVHKMFVSCSMQFLVEPGEIEKKMKVKTVSGIYTLVDGIANLTYDEFLDGILTQQVIEERGLGNYSKHGQLAAIFYRPEKKPEYDPSQVMQRANEFQDVTMDAIWTAYIFFNQLMSEIYERHKRTIFRKPKGDKEQRKPDDVAKKMTWYIHKTNVAKAGVFNLPGMTPMDSVGKTNLWDVLNYIGAERIQTDY